MTKTVKAILIGAGQRGALDYAPYALRYPEQLKFVAVAEPDPYRRTRFVQQHQILNENAFETWEPLLRHPKMAQAALVCTQDQQHTGPTLAAIQQGYDVLVEKPMATTPEECRQMVEAARKECRQLHVAHVLRYTRHFQTLRQVLQSGVLGEIIHVSHRENVAWYHMAHSYVRGNWANQERSSPMIVAKCVHDFDILLWLLDRRCLSLTSTGSLIHFRPENAPEGAPAYCLDGCPAAGNCPYYAPFIYVGHTPLWRDIANTTGGLTHLATQAQLINPRLVKAASYIIPILRMYRDYRGWPSSTVAVDPTPENLMEALRKGPYGRCVYFSDNDVVDHQVVSMEFEGSISVTLTMHGHSYTEGRYTQVQGSHGELEAHLRRGSSWIEVRQHRSGTSQRYDTSAPVEEGHGGGDYALMVAFLTSLQGDPALALTTAAQALEGHLMAFSAEQARLEKRWIKQSEFSGE
jgi:predicted dehydrogenase